MKLIIGGDLVPTKNNIKLFNKGEMEELLGENLLDIWGSCDFKIFNLEVPLTDTKNPIKKCGPNLIAPASTIKGIKKLKPSLIALANNHILDQGEEGLNYTIKLLNESNIPFTGIGKNLKSANKGHILEKNGLKIGVYSCAENEFTIATKERAGANPFSYIDSLSYIEAFKKKCDYLVVLYHGGKEHYRYPSPNLQKNCRLISEKGANLVICQHSHCIGCFEKYNNSDIIYGQGNFLFDLSDSEFWKTSLLIEIDLTNNFKINYIPVKKISNTITLAEGKEKEEILDNFYKRSEEIKQDNFIEEKYKEFSKEMLNNYLYRFSGMNKWLRRVDKYILRNFIFNRINNENRLLSIQNYIECEAHRELLITGIKEKINTRS